MLEGSARAVWITALCSVIGCAQATGTAEPEEWKSSVSMIVFDCMMPVPAGYVAVTGDPKRTSLFSREKKLDGGRIVVSGVDSAALGEGFDVVSEINIGHLSLTRLKYTGTFLPRSRGEEIAIVRNQDQWMVFYGSAISFAEPMARSCLENRDW